MSDTGMQLARATLEFTDEQRKLIRDSFANGANDSEFGVLMEVARARRLNPLLRQIHFVKRWDTQKKCDVWATQVGIDGFRAIAERTGKYDGQDEPEFEYDAKGTIKACKVRVYRKDISRAFVGVAVFSEYVQMKREGGANAMWARGPHFMLAKCAEALGLRKAFPEDMAGLYIPEEMGTEREEKEVNPVPVRVATPAQPALPPSNPGTPALQAKTEAAKAKVKAKLQVVDVQAGETEAQATARAASEPGPMEQISILARELDVDSFTTADIIKKSTGKMTRAELNASDVPKVAKALSEFAEARAAFTDNHV